MPLVESAGAIFADAITNAVASASFTPNANSLIVVEFTAANGNGIAATSYTISGTGFFSGFSWTQLVQQLAGTGGGGGAIWVGDAGSSPTSGTITVTVAPTTVLDCAILVRQFAGALPKASQNGKTGTISAGAVATISITPNASGSQIVGTMGNAAGAVSYTANAATTCAAAGGTGYTQWDGGTAGDTAAIFEGSALTTAGVAQVLGFTVAPAEGGWVAAEILAAPSGVGTQAMGDWNTNRWKTGIRWRVAPHQSEAPQATAQPVAALPPYAPRSRTVSLAGFIRRRPLLQLVPPAVVPPIQVIHATRIVGATSGTIPSTTSGNCLVAIIGTHSAGGTDVITGLTLGGSADNWRALTNGKVVAGAANPGTEVTVWVDPSCAGGQTAIALQGTPATLSFMYILEVVGLGNNPTTDAHASQINTAGINTWSSTASGTTTAANELIVGGVALGEFIATGDTTTGPASPWTNAAFYNDAQTGFMYMAGYQVATATGTFTYAGGGGSQGFDFFVAEVLAIIPGSTAVALPRTAGARARVVGGLPGATRRRSTITGLVVQPTPLQPARIKTPRLDTPHKRPIQRVPAPAVVVTPSVLQPARIRTPRLDSLHKRQIQVAPAARVVQPARIRTPRLDAPHKRQAQLVPPVVVTVVPSVLQPARIKTPRLDAPHKRQMQIAPPAAIVPLQPARIKTPRLDAPHKRQMQRAPVVVSPPVQVRARVKPLDVPHKRQMQTAPPQQQITPPPLQVRVGSRVKWLGNIVKHQAQSVPPVVVAPVTGVLQSVRPRLRALQTRKVQQSLPVTAQAPLQPARSRLRALQARRSPFAGRPISAAIVPPTQVRARISWFSLRRTKTAQPPYPQQFITPPPIQPLLRSKIKLPVVFRSRASLPAPQAVPPPIQVRNKLRWPSIFRSRTSWMPTGSQTAPIAPPVPSSQVRNKLRWPSIFRSRASFPTPVPIIPPVPPSQVRSKARLFSTSRSRTAKPVPPIAVPAQTRQKIRPFGTFRLRTSQLPPPPVITTAPATPPQQSGSRAKWFSTFRSRVRMMPPPVQAPPVVVSPPTQVRNKLRWPTIARSRASMPVPPQQVVVPPPAQVRNKLRWPTIFRSRTPMPAPPTRVPPVQMGPSKTRQVWVRPRGHVRGLGQPPVPAKLPPVQARSWRPLQFFRRIYVRWRTFFFVPPPPPLHTGGSVIAYDSSFSTVIAGDKVAAIVSATDKAVGSVGAYDRLAPGTVIATDKLAQTVAATDKPANTVQATDFQY